MSTTFSATDPIFAPLKRRKWLVLGIVAISVACGVAYTLLAPAVYEAEATVIFPVRQPSVLGVSSGDASALASALGGPTPVRVYAGILESSRTHEIVSEATGLSRKEVKRMTKVLDQSMENSITVIARSRDADLAKKVVQLNLDALESINEDLNMPLAANDVTVLGERISDQRTKIAESEARLLEFQSKAVTAPNVTSSGTGKDTAILAAPSNWVANLRQLEIQLAKVDSEIAQILNWSDRVAENGKDLPTPFPGTEKWRTTLADLEYQLRIAELTYAPSAPEVTKLKDQIEIARKQLDTELAKHVLATQEGFISPMTDGAERLPGLMAGRVALEAQIHAVGRLAQLAPAESIELSRLMREIATNTVILQQLEAQLQVATLQEARDPNRWEVLDEPRLADDPVNKSLLRNGAISVIVGFIIACVVATSLGRKPDLKVLLEDERQAA